MAQNNGRTWTAFVPLVTAVLYGASPVDLIPDLLLLVGWVDDGMMAVAMGMLSVWMFFRARRRVQRADGPVPPYLPVRS
jgi:uncharacterized membrane protein YkvA (DUF1232 family)